jgi:hypothetical protein
MDPVTLIVTALAAGGALGLKDTASSAVRDAYETLKTLVKQTLSSRPAGELALARYEQTPQTWRAPLEAELTTTRAGDDTDLVAAAQVLMSLVDAAGSRAGKYSIELRGAQGVQIGDHNQQHNVFHGPPTG